jgi:hypothetical protein
LAADGAVRRSRVQRGRVAEKTHGRAQVVELLRRKWDRELGYRLRKSWWAFAGNGIAVRFEHEYHDDSGQ